MPRYAVVAPSGVVVSILSGSNAEDIALNVPVDHTAHQIDDPSVMPGTHRYDADTERFVPLPVEPTLPASSALTRLAYQRLFTQAERIAVRGSTDPIVIDFRELAAMAEEIDLADPDVMSGTRYLEALGLIGAGRADDILAGTNAPVA